MTQAIVEAAVITFVPLLLLTGGPKDFGTEQSLFFYGCTTFTLVVLVANSKVGLFAVCVIPISRGDMVGNRV